jgi:uncharacterized repeat protein (TIGR02543 family)
MERNKYPVFGAQKKLVTLTVQFETFGGTPVPSTIFNILPGTVIDAPPSPSRGEDTFLGWFEDPLFNIPWISNNPINSNLTIYAKWALIRTITFVSSGSQVESITAEEGSSISAPTPPTKTGNTFDAWYTNPELTGSPFVFSTMPSQSITLYAKFNKNSYIVSYAADGGSPAPSAQSVLFDELIVRPTNPSKANFDFDEWYKDASLTEIWNFNVDRMPANNLTLYSKYIPRGEAIYTAPGTHTFTVPEGVTSISVVAIGGGSSGGVSRSDGTIQSTYAGSGGALAYKNNISVTPGQQFTLAVGAGGSAVSRSTTGTSNGNSGGTSNFNGTSFLRAAGGIFGNTNNTFLGDGGARGGIPVGVSAISSTKSSTTSGFNVINRGGGGAGGYGSQGGNGGSATTTTPGTSSQGLNGAGSGGGALTKETGYLGNFLGGVGGGSNPYGILSTQNGVISTSIGDVGTSGNSSYDTFPFGAGGASRLASSNQATPSTSVAGRSGVVRIVWGKNRQFPSTNVSDGQLATAGLFDVTSVYNFTSSGTNWSVFNAILGLARTNREIVVLLVSQKSTAAASATPPSPPTIGGIPMTDIMFGGIQTVDNSKSIIDITAYRYRDNGQLGTNADIIVNWGTRTQLRGNIIVLAAAPMFSTLSTQANYSESVKDIPSGTQPSSGSAQKFSSGYGIYVGAMDAGFTSGTEVTGFNTVISNLIFGGLAGSKLVVAYTSLDSLGTRNIGPFSGMVSNGTNAMAFRGISVRPL